MVYICLFFEWRFLDSLEIWKRRSVVHFLSIALFLLVNRQANGLVIGTDQHLSLIFLGKCRDPHLCLVIFSKNYFLLYLSAVSTVTYLFLGLSFFFFFIYSFSHSFAHWIIYSFTKSCISSWTFRFSFLFSFFFYQTSNGRGKPPSSPWCKYLCSSRLYRLALSLLSLSSHKFFENKKGWAAPGPLLYFSSL